MPEADNDTVKFVGTLLGRLHPNTDYNKRDRIDDTESALFNTPYNHSVKGLVSKYILQFPLFISDSISLETLDALRKNIELERGEDISIIFNNGNGSDPLRRYYTASKIQDSLKLIPGVSAKALDEANKELLKYPEEQFNEKSLNDYTLPKTYLQETIKKDKVLKEASDKKDNFSDSRIDMKASKSRNNISPLMLKTTYIDEDGKQRTLNFGIKTVTHPVESNRLVKFLSSRSTSSNFLTTLAKLTSGEISFGKFLTKSVLQIDRSRMVVASNDKALYDLDNLNRLFDNDRLKRWYQFGNKNASIKRIIPNSSLAITAAEAEAIRLITGVDLIYKTNAARQLMDQYMLIDFMIVDEDRDLLYKFDYSETNYDKIKLSNFVSTIQRDVNESKSKAQPLDDDKLKKIFARRNN